MAKAKTTAPESAPLQIGEPGSPSLARVLVPRILLDSSPAEWLYRLTPERRHLVLLATLSACVFFPYLGAVGFWDPWEPHYGEVSRAMIVREDYLHPYWESAYFFSKPVLSLWMSALGMVIAGVNDPARGTAVSTEWWVRSIYALLAIVGVLFSYLAVARTMSRRAAIWTGVVVATSPLYFMLARQAVVDMPFVATNTVAVACLMIAVFEKEHVQDGWLYAFYAMAGVATLAKGLLGIALPGAAMFGYMLLSGDWRLLLHLRLVTGPLVTLLVAGPWYGTMIAFDGKDDESKTFFQRFIIHDHFKRLGFDPSRAEFVGGVHTTTPNTTFVYFPEQIGFGMLPWIAFLPGAFAELARRPLVDTATRKARARLFVFAWLATTFCLFAFAATKFHHYWFPCLPMIAMLIGLFIEDVLERGTSAHGVSLIVGGVLFGMVAQNLVMDPSHLVNMYVYNYERAYPTREVNPRFVFSALFTIAPIIALMASPMVRAHFDLMSEWRNAKPGRLAWLMDRIRNPKPDPSDRLYVVGAAAVLATVFAVYVSAYHWRKLTPHWTQRDLIWTYNQQAKPSEPLAAYQMNWRGETFYSRNNVEQIKEAADIRDFVSPAGREWILVEHSRLSGLKTTLGSAYRVTTVDRSSNKFALVSVEDAK